MKIIYTYTDEAPALATGSLLPIVEAFATAADVEIETRDISLAGRILAQFPDRLTDEQFTADALTELGELAKTPEANIIKLPNISASVPQLKAAIKELQDQGYGLPDYPDNPSSDEEREVRARYDRVKGSAVNPVLREGNSDRRAPASVKAYAMKHPHSMGEWPPESRSHVTTMSEGDFRSTEQSVTIPEATSIRIEHVAQDGTVTVLKPDFPVLAGEVVDGAVMRAAALREFLTEQVQDAKASGLLYSVHLKATMMKVSDPIIFGHAVTTFFPELIGTPGWNPNDGLGALPAGTEIPYDDKPALAMVDSDRGITNLHVPSDVIIDASMPAAIRASGQMWNAQGEQQDTKFVIPDHSYADLYAETVEDCKRNGAFDPATMGTTPNVGLMAQAAEEYGSHDKTFEIDRPGRVRIVDAAGKTLIEHEVAVGDIWRACQTKDAPIRDWVKLAVGRAHATGAPAIFWLDETRAHDAELLKKVRPALDELDTEGTRDPDPARRGGRPLHARSCPCRPGHDLCHRERPARLPHGSLSDPRARHQREDALDRAADGRGRPVRDRRGWLGAQARAAVRQGEPPALGLARRVPRARGLVRAARREGRECACAGAGRHAGPRDRQGARGAQVTAATGRRAGQPRQPLLSGPVLGTGTGAAERGPRTGGSLPAAGRAAFSRRAEDHRRALSGAGPAGRGRRLLPPRSGVGRGRHAALGHAQRRAGTAQFSSRLISANNASLRWQMLLGMEQHLLADGS